MMKKLIEKVDRDKHISTLIIFIILLLILARLVFIFAQVKQGHHSDEDFSYGYANSYYEPYIYMNVNNDIYLSDATDKNVGEWISGEVLKDYVTVSNDERFNYKSVVYNKSGDISPPLYEILLHTICSLFPGTFSWWYAAVINLACAISIIGLVYLIVKKLTDSAAFAILVTLFYGVSTGFISTAIYLRMYALTTVWVLWIFYLFICVEKDSLNRKRGICLYVCTILGAFTHFYFLLFAFFLTLFFCMDMLFKKRVKESIIHGLIMLAGVATFLVMYPSCIYRLTHATTMYDGGIYKYPYSWNLAMCLDVFFKETTGLPWIFDISAIYYGTAILAVALLLSSAALFVFRNEKWMKEFKDKLKQWTRKLKDGLKSKLKNRDLIKEITVISGVLALICTILVVAKVSLAVYMGIFVGRYICYTFPIFVIAMLLLVRKIYEKANSKRVTAIILAIIVSASMLYQNLFVKSPYYLTEFKKGEENIDIGSLMAESDVIILSNFTWRLTWYSTELLNTNRTMLVNLCNDIEEYQVPLSDINPLRDTYIIVERDGLTDDLDTNGENGKVEYRADNFANWNNALTTEDVFEKLKAINDAYNDIEYVYSQDSFCGRLDVYKIAHK